MIKIEPTHRVLVYLAGDYDDAVRACREFVNDVGLCVTVERCAYVYTGGMEDGVVVGLLNYPRFPSTREEIEAKADRIAAFLMDRLYQHSALIVGKDTRWISRREENTTVYK